MHTGQGEGEGRRAGHRGRDPNLECGRPMSGTSHFFFFFYKRGNPSVRQRGTDTVHNYGFVSVPILT